jgi:hypothetical protein
MQLEELLVECILSLGERGGGAWSTSAVVHRQAHVVSTLKNSMSNTGR